MIRVGFYLVLASSMDLLSFASAAFIQEPKQANPSVIVIERGGGFVNPAQSPLAYYWFNVAKDGAWEFKPLRGDTKKGKLAAADIDKWTKEIKNGGFDRLKSNPSLGAADEPYMDITIPGKDKKEQKRIPLQDKLAQAIEKKVFELVKPGK